MKVHPDEIHYWLREAELERLPATPPKPAPVQHQRTQPRDVQLGDDEDGSSDAD